MCSRVKRLVPSVCIYSGTLIIQTPLAAVVWSCVQITEFIQIIKITAEHTNNSTLSAFLYCYH